MQVLQYNPNSKEGSDCVVLLAPHSYFCPPHPPALFFTVPLHPPFSNEGEFSTGSKTFVGFSQNSKWRRASGAVQRSQHVCRSGGEIIVARN